jgi:hypothetical protein
MIEGAIDVAMDVTEELIKNAIKYAKLVKLNDYINDKIKDKKNVDTNFIKIHTDEYVKNYLGFENEESINNFNKIDFGLYENIFPNHAAMISSFICGIILLVMIIFNIITLIGIKCRERQLCCDKCESILICASFFIYIPTFIGFFIYSLVIYAKFIKTESIELAKSVRADKFIEDFLEEFVTALDSNYFILYSIIIISISGFLYIMSFLAEPLSRIECKKNYENQRIIPFQKSNRETGVNVYAQQASITSERKLKENENQQQNQDSKKDDKKDENLKDENMNGNENGDNLGNNVEEIKIENIQTQNRIIDNNALETIV